MCISSINGLITLFTIRLRLTARFPSNESHTTFVFRCYRFFFTKYPTWILKFVPQPFEASSTEICPSGNAFWISFWSSSSFTSKIWLCENVRTGATIFLERKLALRTARSMLILQIVSLARDTGMFLEEQTFLVSGRKRQSECRQRYCAQIR